MLIGSGPGPVGGGVMGRLLRIATSTSISGATTTAGFGGEAISTESGDVTKGVKLLSIALNWLVSPLESGVTGSVFGFYTPLVLLDYTSVFSSLPPTPKF